MKTFSEFIKEDVWKRKPNNVHAFQWQGDIDLIPDKFKNHKGLSVSSNTLSIKTLEGTMTASVNDYIVIGIKDDIFPVKPDIFKKNYTFVKENDS